MKRFGMQTLLQNRFGNQSIEIQSILDYASNHANQPVVVDYCLPEEENTGTLNKTGENNERTGRLLVIIINQFQTKKRTLAKQIIIINWNQFQMKTKSLAKQ
eukprot:Pgem_evm2s12028